MKNAIILIAVMLLLAICLILVGSQSTPEKTAQDYLNALVMGDVETLESCKLPLQAKISSASKNASRIITNSIFNIDLGTDGMDAIAGALIAYTFSGQEFKVTNAEVEGEHAKAFFDIYRQGELSSSDEYLPLTFYKGKWYVDFSGYILPESEQK